MTYVKLTPGSLIAGNGVENIIDNAYNEILRIIKPPASDGVIPVPITYWPTNDTSRYLITQNANKHQLTYGVVGAAFTAVLDYMSHYGYGAATFTIVDGHNQVGNGTVG